MDCRHIRFQIHEPTVDQRYPSSSPFSDLHQLQQLFQAAAFWAKDRRIEEMAIAISNSRPVVSVWDEKHLIGFARATSDGVYRATIWDVVIHPTYQGAGLGRKLVETVLMHPHVRNAERVYLMTTHQQAFYQRIGFQPNSSSTMVLFNHSQEDVSTILLNTEIMTDRR